MKINIKGFAAAFLVLSAGNAPSFAQQALSGDPKEQINQVQAAILKAGARWVAGETSLSNLSPEEWQARVGYNFQPLDAPAIDENSVFGPPPASLDWRDNNGNYVSAVTDQKKCGSCWAFAMTAALESYVLRRQDAGAPVDLSEQVMLSCSGAGSCNGGTLNANFLKTTGLPPESFYPYTALDGNCAAAAAGWQKEAKRIGSWGSVSKTLTALKTALNDYGPLPIAFYVYEDFMHYKSGVYSYTAGKRLGGHGVLLVGYNDAEQYFTVKNSWNTGWGEKGYFKIAYSEMKSPVNFGLSTIAYKSPAAQPREKLDRIVEELNLDGRWGRVEPVFD